jgi:hypothetical protein
LEDPLNIKNIDKNNILEDYPAFIVLIVATNRIFFSGAEELIASSTFPKKQQNSSATSLSLTEKS